MPDTAIARLRIIGAGHAGTTVNVMHFVTANELGTPGDTRTVLLALANAMLECVRTTLLPALPSDWALTKITAQTIGPAVSDEVEAQGILATDVGEVAGTSEVSFVAQLVHIKTGLGGRRRRGRFFLPPPPEEGVTLSKLTAPQIALIAAFLACVAQKFVAPGQSTVWRLGVFSRKELATNGGNHFAAFTEAVSLQLSAVVAKLGSRKFGIGS